jgi:hypothetical protein
MIINKSDRSVGGTTTISGHPRFSLGASGSWSRMLVANWSWIALITIATTAVAAIVAELQTPIYKAQAG